MIGNTRSVKYERSAAYSAWLEMKSQMTIPSAPARLGWRNMLSSARSSSHWLAYSSSVSG